MITPSRACHVHERLFHYGGCVDKEARAIANWVCKVMREAEEELPLTTLLWVGEEAYDMAMGGLAKRDILKNVINQIFLTSVINMPGTAQDKVMRADAGLGKESG